MSKTIVLVLTVAEARGLLACAEEGAGGLLNDVAAGKAYIGNATAIAATEAAIDKLRGVVPRRRRWAEGVR
jgi:hypothetical protein